MLLRATDSKEDAKINSKLAEIWKSLSPVEKAPYEKQYMQEKHEFEKRNATWMQSKEFQELHALESQQKEHARSERQGKKEAEEAEIHQLLENAKARPGKGLSTER